MNKGMQRFFLQDNYGPGGEGKAFPRRRVRRRAPARPAPIQTLSLSSFTSCRQFTICPSPPPSLSQIDAEPDAD